MLSDEAQQGEQAATLAGVSGAPLALPQSLPLPTSRVHSLRSVCDSQTHSGELEGY